MMIEILLWSAFVLAVIFGARLIYVTRKESREMEEREAHKTTVKSLDTPHNGSPYIRRSGVYYPPHAGRTAIPPAATVVNNDSNALLYGAVGYMIGSSGHHHDSSPSQSCDPSPSFSGGGGESAGAGASASWDSGSSSSDSSSGSYDSGSSSSGSGSSSSSSD